MNVGNSETSGMRGGDRRYPTRACYTCDRQGHRKRDCLQWANPIAQPEENGQHVGIISEKMRPA